MAIPRPKIAPAVTGEAGKGDHLDARRNRKMPIGDAWIAFFPPSDSFCCDVATM